MFGSFFVRVAHGEYELKAPHQLLRLLIAMSRKKLVSRMRREGAARRDYRRAQPLGPGAANLRAPEPDPGQRVAGQELLEEVGKRLSAEERLLADQRAEGRDWAQIAAERGESPDALRKRFARALRRVTQELGLDE